MGAVSFHKEFETSKPVNQVIHNMQERARERYGDDPYNGSISTCHLIHRTVKLADEYSKKIDAKADAYIERDNWGRKREISVLDLGVCGYEKVIIKKKAIASKRKTKVVYALRTHNEKFIRSYEDKDKAVEAMMRYASEYQEYCYINKETCMIEGTPTIMEAVVTRRKFKSKPKDMTNVYPIHKYVIYGFAAE